MAAREEPAAQDRGRVLHENLSERTSLRQAANVLDHMQIGVYVARLDDPRDAKSLRLVAANPAASQVTGVRGQRRDRTSARGGVPRSEPPRPVGNARRGGEVGRAGDARQRRRPATPPTRSTRSRCPTKASGSRSRTSPIARSPRSGPDTRRCTTASRGCPIACCSSTVCSGYRRVASRVAVVVLDIDRFKEVNATLGHHHGDLLLEQVARRLSIVVPDSTTVARVGSDEFAVVLPDVGDEASVLEAAERLTDCARPTDLAGRRSRRHALHGGHRDLPRPRRRRRHAAEAGDHGAHRGRPRRRAPRDLPARARQVQPPPAHAHRRASRRTRARTSSSCSTSPTCRSGATHASASRPWCAGTIRRWRWSARTSSSSSPRCRA